MFLSCHHTSQNKSQRFEFGLKEAVGEDKVLVGRRRPVSQDPQVPTDHTRLGVGRKTRTTRNSQEQLFLKERLESMIGLPTNIS